MKKRILLAFILSAILSLGACAAVFLGLWRWNSGMEHLPEGEFLLSSESPDGAYRVDAYLFMGNATTDFAVRCAVVETSTGETRNIYWEGHRETATVEWTDETTVTINGRTLNVLEDSYDYRKE